MFSKKRCKIRKNPQKIKMKFGRKSINYQYLRLKSVMYRISQYRMFACIIVHHSFFFFCAANVQQLFAAKTVTCSSSTFRYDKIHFSFTLQWFIANPHGFLAETPWRVCRNPMDFLPKPHGELTVTSLKCLKKFKGFKRFKKFKKLKELRS